MIGRGKIPETAGSLETSPVKIEVEILVVVLKKRTEIVEAVAETEVIIKTHLAAAAVTIIHPVIVTIHVTGIVLEIEIIMTVTNREIILAIDKIIKIIEATVTAVITVVKTTVVAVVTVTTLIVSPLETLEMTVTATAERKAKIGPAAIVEIVELRIITVETDPGQCLNRLISLVEIEAEVLEDDQMTDRQAETAARTTVKVEIHHILETVKLVCKVENIFPK